MIYQLDMVTYKRDTRRNLTLKHRDIYEITSADMVVIKSMSDCILKVIKLKKILKLKDKLTETMSICLNKVLILSVQHIHDQLRVDRPLSLQWNL